LLLDAGADLLFDLEDFDFRVHQLEQTLQPLGGVDGLQNLLAVRQLDARQMHDDGVRELRRVVDGLEGHQHFGRDALVELGVHIERRLNRSNQRFDFYVGCIDLFDRLDVAEEELLVGDEVRDARPPFAFDENLHRPVRKAQQLDDRADGPDLEDVLRSGVVGFGFLLRREKDFLVLAHRLFEGVDRLLPAYEERHHHVRKHDDVAQGKQGKTFAAGRASAGALIVVVVSVKEHQSTRLRAVRVCAAQAALGELRLFLFVDDERHFA
jgi:hypothetical protein